MRGLFTNKGAGFDHCYTIHVMEIPPLDLKGYGEGVLSRTWRMLNCKKKLPTRSSVL